MVGINSVKGYMPNCHRDLVWTEDLIGGKKKKKEKKVLKCLQFSLICLYSTEC